MGQIKEALEKAGRRGGGGFKRVGGPKKAKSAAQIVAAKKNLDAARKKRAAKKRASGPKYTGKPGVSVTRKPIPNLKNKASAKKALQQRVKRPSAAAARRLEADRRAYGGYD